MDFIFLGGKGSRHNTLYLDLQKKKVEQLSHQPFRQLLLAGEVYLGLVSYDDYGLPWEKRSLGVGSKFVRSGSQIIVDGGKLVLKGQASAESKKYFAECQSLVTKRLEACDYHGFTLQDLATKQCYLRKAKAVIRDIHDGRYYQLNLLRRFVIEEIQGYQKFRHSQSLWRSLATLFFHRSDEMSAWVCLEEEMVVSFSPERFVRIPLSTSHDGFFTIETYPIKGTIRRGHNLAEDTRLREQLLASSKDQRELSMIVDLMRHDLSGVSRPNTTAVVDAGSVVAFSSVFHLVALISSQLDSTLTLSQLLSRLLPAGSITGAPKQEVMAAISEYEGMSRGYFMGNLLVMDHRGFDSSVLIRSLSLRGTQYAEYAAGSGIVFDSDPEREYQEIDAKCAMWQ